MTFKLLPFNGNSVWQNNKPFIRFLLGLLLIYSVLKIIFYLYNYDLIFTGAETGMNWAGKMRLIKWSLLQDMITILGINSFLLFAFTLIKLVTEKFSLWLAAPLGWMVVPFFVLINSFALVLNLADIFYYRFHFQRSNTDLFYVLDHPLNRLMQQHLLIILLIFITLAGITWLMLLMHRNLFSAFIKGNDCKLITVILFAGLVSTLVFKKTFSRLLVPTYPMIELPGKQLPFVQNSFHTFLFSYFRKGEATLLKNYMSNAEADSLMPLRKKLNTADTGSVKKNIVLFIMESVPYDFFDSTGAFKVSMPFFDSLVEKSSFYDHAFCYAHESNKGITAILAGIPTIADIPLYHSAYINMPISRVGSMLKKLNYQSFFCIGDEYDNFGFAKCANWLGIDKYYSEEDIPGYKNIPAHSMGLQDEYVLDFFRKKIDQQQGPFFAVHYNISTHYPYDIPAAFSAGLPNDYTAPMKAMRYYDHSLALFFNAARKEPWFTNTTFIFCSDHWLFPQGKKAAYTDLSAYRIPIIIYDAAKPEKKLINKTVSQFDILGTVLSVAGYRDSIISFGNNLLDSNLAGEVVFTKVNANLFQAIDSSWILGYNSNNNTTEFLYNYKLDKALSRNLVNDKNARLQLAYLSNKVKAFLQKAKMQSGGALFK